MFIINLDEETIIELHKRYESVLSLEDAFYTNCILKCAKGAF
jgi:hypothetical protein